MDEGSVYILDEDSPLESTFRRSLHYNSKLQDSMTYLVEVPEFRNEAPRPSYQEATRPRASSIVNTSQLPDTPKEDPLEQYVRKNLSSFRKSLNPEDHQDLMENKLPREFSSGQIITNTTCAEAPNKTCKVRQQLSDTQTTNKQVYNSNAKETQGRQRNRTKEAANDKINGSPKIKEKQHNNLEGHFKLDQSVVVMPALESVSVTHDSPFAKEKRNSNKRPISRVRVMLAVESSSDNSQQNLESGKRGASSKRRNSKDSYGGHGEKQNRKSSDEYKSLNDDSVKTHQIIDNGKRSTSSKRRESKNSYGSHRDNQSKKFDERIGKTSHQHKDRQSSRDENNTNVSAKRSNNNLSEKNPRNEKLRKKPKDSYASPSESVEDNERNAVVYTIGQSSSEDASGESRLSERYILNKPKKTERSPDSKRKNPPFVSNKNKEVFILTGDNTEDGFKTTNQSAGLENEYTGNHNVNDRSIRIPDRAVGGADKEERQDRDQTPKYITVKAPRSATKMVAKRRYHIQIPQHGRPETWFNVRFNMDDENNVQMNYDGPVKINNYYTSNNYT